MAPPPSREPTDLPAPKVSADEDLPAPKRAGDLPAPKRQSEVVKISRAPTLITRAVNDPLIGSVIGGYRLLERLGEGSMGKVYRARHDVVGGECAVKIVHPFITQDQKLRRRFEREVTAVRGIKHPNVVAIFDAGGPRDILSNDPYFLVMELLQGRPLDAAIAADGPMPPERAARIARDIAAGLAATHAKGFVHRDMKPGNVMLVPGEEGREFAKILDFGVVSDTKEGTDQTQLTVNGNLLGTPTYIAPEQIFGSGVGPRSDLYALGVILYEMVSGAPPFKGTLMQILTQHNSAVPAPLKGAGELEKLIFALLEKSPDKRPESADAVIAWIDRVLNPATYRRAAATAKAPPMPVSMQSAIEKVARPRLKMSIARPRSRREIFWEKIRAFFARFRS